MASIANDKSNRTGVIHRRLLFKAADGERKCIRLGAVTAKQAATILGHADELERCLVDGSSPPLRTVAWLADTIGNDLREKFEAKGLCQPKVKAAPTPTLAELVQAYKAREKWKSLKPNTRRNVSAGLVHLPDHFTGKRRIDEIHEADADDYYAKLMLPESDGGAELLESSANNVCSVAHRLYRFAIKSRLLDRSPFGHLPKGGERGNNVHVGLADSLAVLAELPDTQWKLLFALSRWGGLRCPSEPELLKWGDIDWERKRFTVRAPKTERHRGHGTRVVPIFPELMPLFEARFNEAAEGEELVLPFMQGRDGAGFSYVVKQAIRRAGLEPWPRLWHSMRATRETELMTAHPAHVAVKWIGNSIKVAMAHYAMVSESDFAAAQIAAQTAAASPRTDATAAQATD